MELLQVYQLQQTQKLVQENVILYWFFVILFDLIFLTFVSRTQGLSWVNRDDFEELAGINAECPQLQGFLSGDDTCPVFTTT